MKWLTGLAAGLALSAGTVHAADKWDMPTAYVDSNYHTQNGKLFAEAVGVCTGGDIEIVVHGGGTPFKGGEIHRWRGLCTQLAAIGAPDGLRERKAKQPLTGQLLPELARQYAATISLKNVGQDTVAGERGDVLPVLPIVLGQIGEHDAQR